MSESPDMLEAVLALRERGFSVIPIHYPDMDLDDLPVNVRVRVDPGSKEYNERDIGKLPLVPWEGYQTTLAKPGEVENWWGAKRKWKVAPNIAVVCGKISDIFVVDADGESALAYMASLHVAPGFTLTAKTGRPHGHQFYFRWPGFEVSNSLGQIMPGLDIKGDGGYVIAPPSRHRLGVDYAWIEGIDEPLFAPEELLEVIRQAAKRKQQKIALPPEEITRLLTGPIPDGQRHNDAKRLFAHLVAIGTPERATREFALSWGQTVCKPPADNEHLQKIVTWALDQESSKRRNPEEPKFVRQGDDFEFEWSDLGIRASLKDIRHTGGRLQGSLSITSDATGDIHFGDIVLGSTSAREELAHPTRGKLVRKRSDINWDAMLERICRIATARYREGGPVIKLQPSLSPIGYEFIRYLMPGKEITIGLGDGGAGKSTIAAALCVAVVLGKSLPCGVVPRKIGKALYLDWESQPDEHQDRLAALLRGHFDHTGAPPDLYYRRMTRPIWDEVAFLRSKIAEIAGGTEKMDEVLVIVDSYAPAAGRDPESADAAIAVMSALHALGPATVFLICHVSKEAAERQGGAQRPYGSVFLYNLARSVWEIRASSDTDIPGNFLQVRFNHRKSNRGRRYPPFNWRLDYQEEKDPETGEERTVSITISKDDSPVLASPWEKILSYLRHHERGTPNQITAFYDGLNWETVRKTMAKMLRYKTIVKVDETENQEHVYALAAPKGLDESQAPPEGQL
jgi:hypothetical protein